MNDIKDDPSLKTKLSFNKDKIINVPEKNSFKKNILFYKKIYENNQEADKDNPIKFLSKKALRFKVEKIGGYNKRKLQEKEDTNEGRWTKEEHDKFLDGIVQYGTNWKKVKKLISTRTNIQVRSHAQKFYRKLKMCKDETLGIDFTSDNITSIREMILLTKKANNNYNIKNVFKYLCDKFDNLKKIKKKDSHNYTSKLSENGLKQIDNKIGENNINFIYNNNLNINNNEGCNSYNNLLNLLNVNHMNNILWNNIHLNNVPLNNNILFNHNINYNNILDCQNNMLFNNNLNNDNYSYLNNPCIMPILDKIIFLLRLNNSNIINDIHNSINNIINTHLNRGINSHIQNYNVDSLFNTKVNDLNLNNNHNNDLFNIHLGNMINETIFNTNFNIFDQNYNFQNLINNNINMTNKDINNISNDHNKNIINKDIINITNENNINLNNNINNSTNYINEQNNNIKNSNAIENKDNNNLNAQILNNNFTNTITNKNNEIALEKNNVGELNKKSSNNDNLNKDKKK